MKMKTERLMSLDVLRGITVAGMILVNNPGDWGYIYAPLKHAEWNGLTPTDLVFPFFMFVMGVSMSFSLRKFDYRPTRDFLVKLVRRTAVLFLLGVALSWVSLVLSRWLSPDSTMSWSQILFPFEQVRVWGVLQRLALSYFFASLLVVTVRNRRILGYIVVGILLVYGFILTLGHGFELSTANVIAVVDRAVVGENHMYLEWLPNGGRISFDPEGLVSTLPGIAAIMKYYNKIIVLSRIDNFLDIFRREIAASVVGQQSCGRFGNQHALYALFFQLKTISRQKFGAFIKKQSGHFRLAITCHHKFRHIV